MPQLLIQSALLSSITGLEHGFKSNHTPEGREELNLKIDPVVATVKQVHKDHLLWTNRYEKKERDADALATVEEGLPVGVYSADCTPILIAALDSHDKPLAVMAVHAGWRGTAQQIVAKSFADFHARLAGQGPLRFVAAIGPCISFESFEVSQDVIDAFPDALAQGIARPLREENGKPKYLFNLPGENERQLRNAATEASADLELELLPFCTLREKEHLPSYRRDGAQAGRLLSYLSFRR
jgi:YfiH family protein